MPDIPKIGWNADEVVITSNMYTGAGAFDHVQVLSFAASSIFSATPPPTLTLGTDYFSADRFSGDFAMAATSMHGANPGDPMYFVEENTFADGGNLRVVSATDLLSGSPSFTDTVVPVSSYTFPPAAAQPGGTIATDDTRILNAEYWNGRLVAGQNVGSPLDSDAHARWYEFDVTGSPTLDPGWDDRAGPGDQHLLPGDLDRTWRRHRDGLQPVVGDPVRLGLRHRPQPGGSGRLDGDAHAGKGRDGDLFRLRVRLGRLQWHRRRSGNSRHVLGRRRVRDRTTSPACRPTGRPGSPIS